jgi:hypothetical protein
MVAHNFVSVIYEQLVSATGQPDQHFRDFLQFFQTNKTTIAPLLIISSSLFSNDDDSERYETKSTESAIPLSQHDSRSDE